MEKIDLSFIKKTKDVPNKELQGYGHKNKIISRKRIIKYPKKYKDIHSNILTHQDGDVVMHLDKDLGYKYSFNYKTGYYTRTDYLDKKLHSLGSDVFAANFPHLIDVGIMGHCTHGKSGLCLKSGVQCYQDGMHISKPNMSVESFRKLAEQCKDLTFQFALGGRGDPNEHENFGEILKICRENNIVPNYTTSGFNLTDEQIELTKKYCGAVAVSWYRNNYTLSSIKRFISAGIKTNIHYVLNVDTINEAITMLENNLFPKGANAVVFLTHKPVGLGQKEKCLKYDMPEVTKMFSLIKKGGYSFKVGIDGCFVVGLINSGLGFNMEYLDTCEATRFTCYIDADLVMHPCSFDVNNEYVIDLKDKTIEDAWNSEMFNNIRKRLHKGCPDCRYNMHCMGGCFLHEDIILCPRKENYKEKENENYN